MQSRANMAVYWLGINSHSRTTKYKAQSYPFDACDLHFFFKLRFTPCIAEQPLSGMELQEKEAQKDYSIQEICLQRSYS